MRIAAGTRLGPYEIVESIAAGGMGVVYRARDTRLDREVAVKVLPEHLAADASALGRFRREARAVAALSHPNILALYDIGEEQGQIYAVTELLHGETLRARLARGPVPAAQAIAFAQGIANGLAAAHARHIVHRDLKPENLFITRDDRIKILDFGLAKDAGLAAIAADSSDAETVARHTMPGTILGTLEYMSPEQVTGQEADHQSDIFSFGIVLYEMLSGRRAFSRASAAETMSAILREEPAAPSGREGVAIPSALEPIVRRCLAKEPAGRYASASEVAAALASVSPADAGPEPAPSIAVLPFEDMSPARDQAYFCEGMAEELINGLMRIEGLHVAARSSAFQFKGQSRDVRRVGEALNVRTVLEGSVRTAGTRLRVTAILSDVANGYQIWSKRYDRQLEDVFDIQDEIATDIVRALRVELRGGAGTPRLKRYTANLEAYHAYLQGRYHWFARSRSGLQRATQYFQQAIEKDPGYALAHAGLADLHSVLGVYGIVRPHDAFSRAEAGARRALSIDPELGEAHFSLASKLWLYDFNWNGAEAAFRQALELNPNNAVGHLWYALLLIGLGRDAEANDALDRARQVDPLSAYINSMVGLALNFQGRDEEAIRECRKTLDVEPGYLVALYAAGSAYSRLGRHADALALLERAAALTGRVCFYLGLLGSAYAAAGRSDDARAVLSELDGREATEYVGPLFRAWVLGGLGDLDTAFEQLDRAHAERDGFLVLPGCTAFDPLRRDDRYGRFLQRMGLAVPRL